MDTAMHNSMTESSIWKSAVVKFNERVVEVEKEVTDILRPKLDAIINEPAQVNHFKIFFKNFKSLKFIKDEQLMK